MSETTPSRRVVSVHGPHSLSGVSTWISRLLASAGSRHEWHALVTGSDDELRTMGPFPGDASGRVRRLAWDARPRAATRRINQLREALHDIGTEVIIPNYVPEAFAAAALDASARRRTIGVCHSRDAWYLELFEHAGPALDAAWTVSDECTQLIKHTLAPGTPLKEAPYAGPLGTTPTPPPGTVNPTAPLQLVYLGRLDSMQKRVILLADFADELWRRSVPFHLNIAGDGPEHERLASRLSEHIHHGRASLLGTRTPTESQALLTNSDALVLTSAYEGTPLAAIEAMCAARPVLITEGCGGACHAVRHYNAGAVVPRENAQALAQAAERFARDRAALSHASTNALKAGQSFYSSADHIHALDDLIDRSFDNLSCKDLRARAAWEAALRTASLAAERGPRDLGWRARRTWRRTFCHDACPPPLSLSRPRVQRIGGRLLRSAVADLEQRGLTRVAVFPAGRHSRLHGRCLQEAASVRCFVDDTPTTRRLHGKPVLTPENAIKAGIDAIVISSDQYEPMLLERAQSWAGDLPIATLYVPVRMPQLSTECQSP